MNVESSFQLGYVTRPHGIDGEVLVFLDTDEPEKYNLMESVFVEINQKLVPFFIESLQIRQQNAIVKLEGIDDRESSENLKGCGIFLPLELLPDLESNQFYYHEVIGFSVVDSKIGNIGSVKSIYEAGGNDLFSVSYEGKEILVPIRDELITGIDKSGKNLYVDLPDGLVDIYLNP